MDGYGFHEKYASVNRFVRKLGRAALKARVVIETAAGEEAQVDYGAGPMGARSEDRQIPAYAVVRSDAGLQP